MIKTILLDLGVLLFLLIFIVHGVVILWYPKVSERIGRYNEPTWLPKWWPRSNPYGRSYRSMGLAFIIFGVSLIVWMLRQILHH